MNNCLKEINKNTKEIIYGINKLIFYFRSQNYDRALRTTTGTIDKLNMFIDQMISFINSHPNSNIEFNQNMFLKILQELFDVQEKRDYILLTDIYEVKLLPILINLQESITMSHQVTADSDLYKSNINILSQSNHDLSVRINQMAYPNPFLEKGYYIEPTSCGDMTLAVDEEDSKLYFHSNINVSSEAFIIASSWYSIEKTTYIIYGLGLGYHINELHKLDEYIEIEVYESDINIIQLASAYTDNIKLFENAHIKLVYDPKFTQLYDRISKVNDDTEFVIHYPSLKNIKDSLIKERLEDYFIQQSSVKNQIHLLNGNFRYNIKNYDYLVDDLKKDFQDKDVYIVAAGPSLDKNFKSLRDVGEKGIILATGTVFRKLLRVDIVPDYVIVTDANKRVYAQISGLEESAIPMLYLSTAYRGFAEKYKGDRYIILQKGYKKAEEFAKKNGYNLYATGGSVSTTALEIGIRLGCRKIIFLGLDLAYTDDYVHASGTSRRELEDSSNLIEAIDIYGNTIKTTKVLNIYRKWIEERIKDIRDIEIIDATEGGVRIKGMVYKGGY